VPRQVVQEAPLLRVKNLDRPVVGCRHHQDLVGGEARLEAPDVEHPARVTPQLAHEVAGLRIVHLWVWGGQQVVTWSVPGWWVWV
jgi:hypothetical protein